MSVKVASDCLNSCSGCEIAILNLGETFLDLLQEFEFVHIPILMDHKYYGQSGEQDSIHIPEADVGFLSGGIRNQEHLDLAREMRKKCKVLIALGTCATHGGIPAMINAYSNKELFDEYFLPHAPESQVRVPDKGVPELLERCYALDEHITVDLLLPGCPPHPHHIGSAFFSFLKSKNPAQPFKSVCDTCPTLRKGKGNVKKIKRFVTHPDFDPEKPIGEMQCLLEQGYLCSGPVTRAGCAVSEDEAPRCISARVPCRGCYGPVKQEGNQMLDMLNALASNNIDISSLVDRDSLLRFSGAHNRLIRKKGGL